MESYQPGSVFRHVRNRTKLQTARLVTLSMKAPQTINTCDVQVTGETGRVLFDKYLMVRGDDMAARLQYCRDNLQDLRKAVLREPRGHANLMGVLVVPAVESGSDFGVIIMEQADFAPMSGANLMCAVTAVLETQQVFISEPVTDLRVDTAAGTIEVSARIEQGRVTEITIENVPSFAVILDQHIEVPEFGDIAVDVSFGGQFYVLAPAAAFGLELELSHSKDLTRVANMLLAAAREQLQVVHPGQPHLDYISLPILYERPTDPTIDGRGAVVMPLEHPTLDDPSTWDVATLDRSPGGTGTCARMAVEYARGNLQLGEDFVQQSLLGTTFTGRLEREIQLHGQTMLQPTLTGRGWIIGHHQLVIAPDDPFPTGFVL